MAELARGIFTGPGTVLLDKDTGEPYNASGSSDAVEAALAGYLTTRGYAFDVTVTPLVSAGAYSAGDIVGGLLTFQVARANDEMVIITGLQISVKAAVTSTLTLVLFNADPTATTKTDNAAYSLNAADAFKIIKAIPILALNGYVTDHGTPNDYSIDNLVLTAKPATGTKSIYGLLIDATGWTLTTTADIQVRLRGVGA